jgi:murein DD-endopeptidase MepM/ murein hydrolase activator NlpD
MVDEKTLNISIDHENGYATLYKHLSAIAPGIQEGVRVHAGQVIGYSGEPHLHFELDRIWMDGNIRRGEYVNPVDFYIKRCGGRGPCYPNIIPGNQQ